MSTSFLDPGSCSAWNHAIPGHDAPSCWRVLAWATHSHFSSWPTHQLDPACRSFDPRPCHFRPRHACPPLHFGPPSNGGTLCRVLAWHSSPRVCGSVLWFVGQLLLVIGGTGAYQKSELHQLDKSMNSVDVNWKSSSHAFLLSTSQCFVFYSIHDSKILSEVQSHSCKSSKYFICAQCLCRFRVTETCAIVDECIVSFERFDGYIK